MNLVTAGDINNSFLWHKIQTMSDLAMLGSQCAMAPKQCSDCNMATPCGATMPYLNVELSTANPDFTCTIKNWIQNGAQNN